MGVHLYSSLGYRPLVPETIEPSSMDEPYPKTDPVKSKDFWLREATQNCSAYAAGVRSPSEL
jgi:hypothetical protein